MAGSELEHKRDPEHLHLTEGCLAQNFKVSLYSLTAHPAAANLAQDAMSQADTNIAKELETM